MRFKSLAAVTLTLVLAFSLAGLLQRQREADIELSATVETAHIEPLNSRTLYYLLKHPLQHYGALVFAVPSIVQNTVIEKAPLPENLTRTQIYNFINANPGMQFRAICGSLGLSIGVVQFHLSQLQRSGLVTSFRKGRYKRFFVADRFTQNEIEAIAAVRLDTVRCILKALLHGKGVGHASLAKKVQISSQGLTWQMHRLLETGLVLENQNGISVSYTVSQKNLAFIVEALALTRSPTYLNEDP